MSVNTWDLRLYSQRQQSSRVLPEGMIPGPLPGEPVTLTTQLPEASSKGAASWGKPLSKDKTQPKPLVAESLFPHHPTEKVEKTVDT